MQHVNIESVGHWLLVITHCLIYSLTQLHSLQ